MAQLEQPLTRRRFAPTFATIMAIVAVVPSPLLAAPPSRRKPRFSVGDPGALPVHFHHGNRVSGRGSSVTRSPELTEEVPVSGVARGGVGATNDAAPTSDTTILGDRPVAATARGTGR